MPPVPFFEVEDRASYGFRFLQKDGSLMSFGNNDNCHRLFQVGAPSYEKPAIPSWDNARAALERHSKFLLWFFYCELKVTLGEPNLRYVQHNTNNRYYAGEWNISWPRVDSQGHAFDKDGVFMSLPEGFAPSTVLIKQSAHFIERGGHPMALEAALEYATRRISSERWWDVFLCHISRITNHGEPLRLNQQTYIFRLLSPSMIPQGRAGLLGFFGFIITMHMGIRTIPFPIGSTHIRESTWAEMK